MQLGTYTRHDRRRRRTTHPYFQIAEEARLRHVYVLGKTGVGKSTALVNWALGDTRAGRGCFFLDPHGDDAETLLTLIPPARRRDVIYFNPAEFPIAFNLFDGGPKERRAFVASSIVDALKSIWHMDYAPNVEMFASMRVISMIAPTRQQNATPPPDRSLSMRSTAPSAR